MAEDVPKPAMLGNLVDITDSAWGRCQADYDIHGQPLERHAEAERLLRANPRMRLWFEIIVVSYLVGVQPPRRPKMLAHPFGPVCLNTCFVVTAHGVDSAVAERRAGTTRMHGAQGRAGVWSGELLTRRGGA